ncbi:MAG: hypothetical protein N2A42_11150 [Luteolibacter sp.]
MPDSYTIKKAQQKFCAVEEEASDHPVTVLVSIERMATIRKHRSGKAVYHDLCVLDTL